MKRSILIGFTAVLIVSLIIGCSTAFAAKKTWGKQNKIANEIAVSIQNLYINILQVLEKGINDELGDPDILEKFKDDITKKYNPELVPESLEEIETFASSFIEEVIDFHKNIEEGDWADSSLISELKDKTMQFKPSIVRISPSKVAKFQAWGIDYPARINLGISIVEISIDEALQIEGFSELYNDYIEADGLENAGVIIIKGVLPDSPLSQARVVYDHLGPKPKGSLLPVLSYKNYIWVLTYIDEEMVTSQKKLFKILDELKPGKHEFGFMLSSGIEWGCRVSAIINETQY